MSVENTLAERGARYGDFTDHARIAQQLQDVMHRSGAVGPDMAINKGWCALSPVQKQALTVIADKIARILSGDPNYTDNWHDIQGYAKLAEDRCVDTTLPQFAFPNERDPLAGHRGARREQDEFVCTACGKRWAVSDPEAPPCA
jgi:hypothetical protein